MSPSSGPIGSSRVRAPVSSEAGWRDSGVLARDSLRLTNGGAGAQTLMWPEGCAPLERGTGGRGEKCELGGTAKAGGSLACRVGSGPRARSLARMGGNHPTPREVPGGCSVRAYCAPCLGVGARSWQRRARHSNRATPVRGAEFTGRRQRVRSRTQLQGFILLSATPRPGTQRQGRTHQWLPSPTSRRPRGC